MNWSMIAADLADVLKAMKSGRGVLQALKQHGFDECKLYWKCGICGAKTFTHIKPVLDRHSEGQDQSFPTRCNDANCNGHVNYDGVR